ncbi:hypothetical protein LENED_012387 [Lentinula edodes]|uniref:Uncharacterized protein n=1 Tax=Lentinula edodes TaxID=5353 RepID=A0A1Q3ESJ9_LENED|nr:hypothetical protein LENED_012387 [Lentinula edodes]
MLFRRIVVSPAPRKVLRCANIVRFIGIDDSWTPEANCRQVVWGQIDLGVGLSMIFEAQKKCDFEILAISTSVPKGKISCIVQATFGYELALSVTT